MKYPAYEKYKDSGVEWIGMVPFDWKTWKVSHGFNLIGSGTTPNTEDLEMYDGEIPWITTSELRENYIIESTKNISDKAFNELSTLKLYPEGTLLIAMYGATIGRMGILGIEATVNQACCALAKPSVFNTRFVFYWLFMARPVIISLSSGGGQPNLNQDTIKKLKIPTPSLSEQLSIANFLDRETARIDALIQKKQKLIDTLNEKRIAVISHAVTKGVGSLSGVETPNAPLKDSGIEWLGMVPEHWEVKKLKYVVSKVGSGITPDGGATVYEEEGIPFIRSQNIYSNRFKLDDIAFINKAIHDSMSNSKVKEGDVLLNITGASLGRCFYMENLYEEANVNQHVCIIRPIATKLLTRFLHLLLISDSGQQQIWNDQTGSGREGLNFVSIKNFTFSFPADLDEQRNILNVVNAITDKLDQTIEKATTAITKLEEYKTALISAAVTGKIKVPETIQSNQ